MVTLHRASRVALQLRGTPSHACAFAKKIYGRSKVENGRTKLIVLGQIVHTLFISNFILCAQQVCGLERLSLVINVSNTDPESLAIHQVCGLERLSLIDSLDREL